VKRRCRAIIFIAENAKAMPASAWHQEVDNEKVVDFLKSRVKVKILISANLCLSIRNFGKS